MRSLRSLVGKQVRAIFGMTRAIPRVINTALNNSSSSTTFSVTAPTGAIQNGDLLIAHLVYTDGGSGDSISLPSNWSTLNASGGLPNGDTRRWNVYYKFASSEGAAPTYTWTNNTAARRYYLALIIIRNVDQNNPFGSTGYTNYGTTGTNSYASSSITPAEDGSLLIEVFMTEGSDSGNVFTPGSGWTQWYQYGTGGVGTNRAISLTTRDALYDERTEGAVSQTITTNENLPASNAGRSGILEIQGAPTISR